MPFKLNNDFLYAIAEKNNEPAFDELIKVYFSGLLSFAISIVKDRHIAEEVVEDVFVKLWENRKILPSIKNLSHYLYISTKNTCLNTIKNKSYAYYKNKVNLEDIGDADAYYFSNEEDNLISKDALEKINEAISKLPPRCKLIFRLVKEDNLKYSEVSQLLNISMKTVENQMNIAIKKFAEIIKISLPEFANYYPLKKSK